MMRAGHDALAALAQANPEAADLQSDLADSFRSLGHVSRDHGRPAEALGHYSEALRIMEKLVRQNPTVTDFRNDLAKCYFDLASVHKRARHDREQQAYERAKELRLELVRANPDNLVYRFDLGLTLNNLGWCLSIQGHRQEGLALLREARTHRRFAFDRAPGVPWYRRGLSSSLDSLANAYQALGQFGEAAAVIEERQALWPGSAAELGRTARDLARIAGAVGKSRSPVAATDDHAEQERYAARALAYLAQALAAGYHDVETLEEHASFSVLRDRDDFKKKLDDLKAKMKKPPSASRRIP
jgi:tetratricopeptide (TPR) repeat protein